ncbi:hypothetical protein [Lysobacter gummosus]|uniref:hypothetical protein n=1 Tax=Lysobacter gummosus TaxID=262324 RepID=UPI0036457E43
MRRPASAGRPHRCKTFRTCPPPARIVCCDGVQITKERIRCKCLSARPIPWPCSA